MGNTAKYFSLIYFFGSLSFIAHAQDQLVSFQNFISLPGSAKLRVMDGGSYYFGHVQQGSSLLHSFKIRNEGSRSAINFEMDLVTKVNTPFTVGGAQSCRTTIHPDEVCVVTVEFVPHTVGTFKNIMRLTYYDGSTDRTQDYPIHGASRSIFTSWPPAHMQNLPQDRLDRALSGLMQGYAAAFADLKCSDTTCSDLPSRCQADVEGSGRDYCLLGWSSGGIAAFTLNQNVDMVNRYFASDKCCGDFNPAPPSGIGAWGTVQLRFYGLFNAHTGLIKRKRYPLGPPEAILLPPGQVNIERAMFGLLKKYAKLKYAKQSPHVFHNASQNRYIPSVIGYLLISQWLRKNPSYAPQRLDDDSTLEQQYQAWREWISKFLDRRIKNGMWSEVGIGYEDDTVEAIVNLYDFAEDPILSKKAEMVMDLHFANAAEESLLNTHGGPKSRTKNPMAYDATFRGHRANNLLFGVKEGFDLTLVPQNMFGTSAYQVPPAVMDLANDSETRGSYAFIKRAPGPGVMSMANPRNPVEDDEGNILGYKWFAFNPNKSMLRYGFVGQNYILGSSNFDPADLEGYNRFTHEGPMVIGSAFAWAGVTFKTTSGRPNTLDARISFEVQPGCSSGWISIAPLSVLQFKNVLIAKRFVSTNAEDTGPNASSCNPSFLKIYFSQTLDEVVDRGDGWIFARSGEAFAALRVVRSGHRWVGVNGQPTTWSRAGMLGNSVSIANLKFVVLYQDKPVVMMVNDARDYGNDFARFQASAKNKPFQYNELTGELYTSPLAFYGHNKVGKIAGERVDFSPSLVNDSSFIKSVYDSGLVCIKKEHEYTILDVRDPNHPIKQNSSGGPYPTFCPVGTGQDHAIKF